MKGKSSGKSLSPQAKELIAVVVVLILMAGGIFAYWQQRNNTGGDVAEQTNQAQSEDVEINPDAKNVEEIKDALTGEKLLEDYKSQMADAESLSDEERWELYVNAAFLAADLGDKEAPSYAQKALDDMPPQVENAWDNREMIANLRAIASGDYQPSESTEEASEQETESTE